MERQKPLTFPVVVIDALKDVQLSLTTAVTDLYHAESTHGYMLDHRQRKVLQVWYRQLDEIGRQIGQVLGG